MKVLITGSHGMLGRELVPYLANERGHTVFGYGRAGLNIADSAQISAVMQADDPDVVIQCAAYTNVDGAEADPLSAFLINAAGTQNVALACQAHGIPLLYISSDYVFDGASKRPYLEIDATGPRSVYGQSKLAGEIVVRELLNQFYIVRTSWLYGRFGKNFVDTMRRLGREKPELGVVADQHGAPTWTGALVVAIADLIASKRYGTYHVTNQGSTTWFALTQKILEAEGLKTPLKPLSTAELGRPAPRPANSVLNNLNLSLAGFAPLPSWEESLMKYLALSPFEGLGL